MSELLEKVKRILSEDQWAFWNEELINSIEAFNTIGTLKLRSYEFFRELKHILEHYEKEELQGIFLRYLDIEFIVEAISLNHISHINHIVQVFFLGVLILEKLKVWERNHWNKRKLVFAWMMAALFHDVGYDVERYKEEEQFRIKRNNFWTFMTRRSFNSSPLRLKKHSFIKNVIVEYIMNNITPFFVNPNINYEDFINLFKIGDEIDFKYDHGFISALKYHFVLKKFDEEESRSGQSNPITHKDTLKKFYRDWDPNIQAIRAMALHNFRKVEQIIYLNSNDKNAFIPYLLIICDEIQLWDSDKPDISTIPIEERAEKKEDYMIKKIELNEVNPTSNRLELKLKVTLLKNTHEAFNLARQYLDEKIVEKIAKTYPCQGDTYVSDIFNNQFHINSKRIHLIPSFNYEIRINMFIESINNEYSRWFSFII